MASAAAGVATTAALHAAIVRSVPFVEMRRSLLKSARRAHKRSERAGINALSVRERLPSASDDEIVMPNPEFAFAGGAFDLAGGPVVFTCRVPGTGNYWSLSLFAGNTDNFFCLNDASIGGGSLTPVKIILCARGTTARDKARFQATVESEATTEAGTAVILAESPTLFGMALHRVFVPDRTRDGDAAIAFLREHFALAPLRTNRVQIRSQAPPSAGLGLVVRGSPLTPALVALAAATVLAAGNTVKRAATLWGTSALAAIATTVASLKVARRVAAVRNGPWRFTPGYGSPSTSAYVRAVCAVDAIFALIKEEAVYGIATTDSSGQPLRADRSYVLAGRRDLGCRWWGIVAYDHRHFLIHNEEDRYSVNNKIVTDVAETTDHRNARTNGSNNHDQRWKAFFCAERPARAAAPGEWLPMGPRRSEHVVLVLRLYCPSPTLLPSLGTTELPTITDEAAAQARL